MPVLVIAEPGCTHEGDKATMLRLLETAAQCGANVWKPQWTSDPVQMCERRHIGPKHPKREYYLRAYSWLAFPVEWHEEFRDRCHVLGMEYACTAFLPQDAATVAAFVDWLKVASFEAADVGFVRLAQLVMAAKAETNPFSAVKESHVLVSTGMMDRVPDYRIWEVSGVYAPRVLHCVSAYPAPLDEMNIAAVCGSGYGGRSDPDWNGLSDHSRHLLAGALAVACGAEIVEAHYRLDTCHPSNPDYAVAFTPAEFTQYIRNIRDAEAMMGDGIKRRQPCEDWALPYRVTS